MIEVIKYGTRKEITCPKCGSLLAYTAEDIQISGDYTLPNCSCIACPVCKFEILLANEEHVKAREQEWQSRDSL